MPSATGRDTAKGRVAVVDDEAEIGDIIRRALRRRYDVDVYETASDAYAALEEGERYDVIMCDLLMPDISGRDVFETLVDRWPDQAQRVVFMSGVSREGARDEILADIDAPMIEKPFRLGDLRRTVRHIAAEHEAK